MKPTVTDGRRTNQKGLLTIGVLLILAVITGVIVLLTSGVLGGDDDNNSPETAASEQTYGTLTFDAVDTVALHVEGLPLPEEGKQYEAWLLGDETRRSMGVLELDEHGDGTLQYTDENGATLLSIYGGFEITVEPSPDNSELPSDTTVYSGTVPAQPLVHIRHLLVDFGATPNDTALVMGLVEDSALVSTAAETITTALEAGDLDTLRSQGEALVNIIEGTGGADFGDVDGNGSVDNPADGFGLLPGSETAGYIQTSIEHARYSASSPGATQTVIDGARDLEASAQNLGGWATQLRDLGLQLARAADIDAARDAAPPIIDLAARFLNGDDSNGNGTIDPSEGGALSVYAYARRMANMPVVSGPAAEVAGPESHGASAPSLNEGSEY